jgi:hypothetical protein
MNIKENLRMETIMDLVNTNGRMEASMLDNIMPINVLAMENSNTKITNTKVNGRKV